MADRHKDFCYDKLSSSFSRLGMADRHLEIGRGIIMKVCVLVGPVLAVVLGGCSSVRTQQLVREEPADKVLLVRQTEDFVISGRGDASA